MADLLTVLDPPATVPGDSSNNEFDWISDDSIIIQKQPPVAVYRNRADAVVIRQEGSGYDDGDHFVMLAGATEVRMLIAALQRELRG